MTVNSLRLPKSVSYMARTFLQSNTNNHLRYCAILYITYCNKAAISILHKNAQTQRINMHKGHNINVCMHAHVLGVCMCELHTETTNPFTKNEAKYKKRTKSLLHPRS